MIGNTRIHMIAAMGHGRVIGDGSKMGFHDSEDMEHFKNTTLGHTVVMGRKTHESLPHGFLKGRENLILSQTLPPGVLGSHLRVFSNIEDVMCHLITFRGHPTSDPVWVIGGGEIYRLFLPYVDEIHLTEMDRTIDGNVVFPDILGRGFLLHRTTYGSERPGKSPNHYHRYLRIRSAV